MAQVKKLLLVLSLLLVLAPIASADWFDESIISEIFEDGESGAMSLLVAVVSLYVIVAAILVLGGAILQKKNWVTTGLGAYGVLILLAIIYPIALSLWNHFIEYA